MGIRRDGEHRGKWRQGRREKGEMEVGGKGIENEEERGKGRAKG